MTDPAARPPEFDSPAGGGSLRPPQISLAYLFYGVAMLAATLATFGTGGIILGLGILAFWTLIYSNKRLGLMESLVTVLILFGLCAISLPVVSHAPQAGRRSVCSNNLKQIALALHNYHNVYQSLPPAYLADPEGRPTHSWRVLILPFAEQQSLYDRYRFDEPWDGPNNRKLAAEIPFDLASLLRAVLVDDRNDDQQERHKADPV